MADERRFIPYAQHVIEQDDIDAVIAVLRSDRLTQGPKVEEYEAAFAEKVGAKYAVACSSGTAALHLACLAGNVKKDTEVVMPPITFVATENAVDYDKIQELVAWRTVIADACHSLGASYHGMSVGSIADITCFSTHAIKSIATGEGGMCTTDDEDHATYMRHARNHNRGMKEPGYNYRLTEMQAALGLSQLKKLDRFMARRQEIFHACTSTQTGLQRTTSLS